ncbi:MAG: diaminopimelate decarboxylase, partial [Chloroflexota bacterium]
MRLGTQRVNVLGHLEIGGCDTVELAERFGTPLYVMDEALIRRNCREYKAAFEKRYPKIEISFATKAFLCTAICGLMAQEDVGLDVASGGELYTALRARFPVARIALHGNNKSEDELRLALENNIGRIVVDNLGEIEHLDRLAAELGVMANVSIRATPGIDPHTHKLIRTGQEDSKFGLNIANGAAMQAAQPDPIVLTATPGMP